MAVIKIKNEQLGDSLKTFLECSLSEGKLEREDFWKRAYLGFMMNASGYASNCGRP